MYATSALTLRKHQQKQNEKKYFLLFMESKRITHH